MANSNKSSALYQLRRLLLSLSNAVSHPVLAWIARVLSRNRSPARVVTLSDYLPLSWLATIDKR